MKPILEYFIIKNDIYPFEILVSFQTNKEYKKTIKNHLPIELHKEVDESIGDGNARTYLYSNNAVSIKFNNIKTLNHGQIAHEIFHAVSIILENIGMKLSSDSDEAYAYFIQFVTNEIYKSIEI